MKHYIKCGMVAMLLFLFSTLLYLVGFLDNADHLLGDRLYASHRSVDPNIFVIGIDGDTLDRYGPWGTWSRRMTADLIRYLNEDEASKPAVIGVDIMFSGNTTDGEDGSLVEAVKDGGNVVLASQAFFSSILMSETEERLRNTAGIQKYEEPFDELAAVAPSGLINVFADSDGIVRRGIYNFRFEGQELYSFSAQIAKAYTEHLGTTFTPPGLDKNGEWYVPFPAKPGDYFGVGTMGTSWVRVMEREIPRELFADSIVLIGPYSTGMLDNYYTSSDRSAPMYGLEIHANMVQCLLEGNYKLPLPGYLTLLLVLFLSVLVYGAFCLFHIKGWTVVTILTGMAYVGVAYALYQVGWVLPILYPVLAMTFIYLALLITNSVALTLEKASLYDQMQRLFINSIRTIANAIDAKDPCTSGHCQRVAEYSLLLGKALHYSEKDLADLEYSALLHDVGKIGISDNVLKKEGPLTDEEYAEMKTHPFLGAQILGGIKEFSGRIAQGARYHHERYDGRGYCDGIRGEEIPIFGRIIAIADAYDAMTQNRPYHRRLPQEVAIGEIEKNKGTQFDPELAELFIKVMENCPPPEESKPIGHNLPPKDGEERAEEEEHEK